MSKVFIDDTTQQLILQGFDKIADEVTIKVFGTNPQSIVLVPGNHVSHLGQIAVAVKDSKIENNIAYEIFRKYSDYDEVLFLESEGEYYQYTRPDTIKK